MGADGILTPVGRIVQGHPMVEQTKGYGGKPMTTKDGAPRSQYFFAIAIPKTDPGWATLWQTISAEAQRSFPNGEWNRPDFAWKVTDGDAAQNKGKEGFAGCWVVKCAGGFAPKVWTAGGKALIVDQKQIKCGDYVRAMLNIAGNDDKMKPGVYLNPVLVELVGYGQEIVGGPDGAAVFSQAPAAVLPPGASATPVAGAPIATPGPTPSGGMPGPGPGPMPGGPVAGGPLPVPGGPPVMGNVMPAPDILRPPAPGPQKTMTPKAGQFSYEQMIAAGWTDATLVQHGYMIIS